MKYVLSHAEKERENLGTFTPSITGLDGYMIDVCDLARTKLMAQVENFFLLDRRVIQVPIGFYHSRFKAHLLRAAGMRECCLSFSHNLILIDGSHFHYPNSKINRSLSKKILLRPKLGV